MRPPRPALHTLLPALALVAAATAAQADIHLGVIVSTTGPGASLGMPAEQAVRLWPAELAGEKLRITLLNDNTDPTAATKNAAKLISEDKVDAIIGSTTTPNSLAMIDVVAETSTPTMSTATSSPKATMLARYQSPSATSATRRVGSW